VQNNRAIDIIKIRDNNPCATLQNIGDKVGCSREYVRQVLSKNEKPTKHWVKTYQCNQCGKVTRYKKFCSRECQAEYTKAHRMVECVCDQCGKPFQQTIYQLKHKVVVHNQDKFFCNRHCRSVYCGFQKDHPYYK
jgi:hypothetical protein